MTAVTHSTNSRLIREESDQCLVELARRGNPDAFEAIVTRYRPALLRHCRRLLLPVEAEEAVQETFLIAYRTIRRTSADLRLGGWLFRIAHNVCLGVVRRNGVALPIDEWDTATESADVAVIRQERLRLTLSALADLPEDQRRVLLAREFAGLGHREIAARLGRSEGAVRQLLSRARTQLRRRVGALTPIFLRIPPAGEDHVSGPLAAKLGALVGVGLAAAGGSALLVSPGILPALSAAARPSAPPRVAGATSAHVFAEDASGAVASVLGAVHRGSAGQPPSATRGSIAGARARKVGQRHSARTGTTQLGSARGSAAPSSRSRTGAGKAPAGAGTVSVAPAAAPARPATAPGLSGAPTSQAGSVAGQSGNGAGQSGPAPGQSGTAPGQAGTTPGQSGTAPGQAGTTPGQSGTAPGQSGTAPGQAGSTPGQAGTTPGQAGTTPGQPGTAPGRSGTAQGHNQG